MMNKLRKATKWSELNWAEIELTVFNWQQKIYNASKRGEIKLVHELQKMLVKSKKAKLLAIRRITQDNQGKSTAGIDGIKSIKPEDRFKLIEQLTFDEK